MPKVPDHQQVARRQLFDGYVLAAYAIPGEDRAKFRILSEKDQTLSLQVSAEDATALCAMLTKV